MTSTSSKRLRAVLFGFAAFFTVIALLYAWEDWHGNRLWRQYVAESEASGENNRLSDFVPPKVPDAQNFAKTEFLREHAMRRDKVTEVPPFANLISQDTWRQLGSYAQGTFTRFDQPASSSEISLGPEQVKAAKACLDRLAPAKKEMEELRTAMQRPFSRFDTEGRFDDPIVNFVLLRSMAQAFEFHALASLYSDDANTALSDLLVIHKIADGLRGHPTLVASMIRCALLGLDKQVFYEGWVARKWSAQQYRGFMAIYASAEALKNVDLSLRGGERAGVRDLIETHKPSDLVTTFHISPVDQPNANQFHAALVNGVLAGLPRGWWSHNLAVHHRVLDGILRGLYDRKQWRMFPEFADEANGMVEASIEKDWLHHLVAAVAIPNVSKAMRRVYDVQAVSDQASLVCALEIYKGTQGSYPATLQELAPKFIPVLPKDLITGELPIYRRNDDGTFTLYNVGWNSRDDGAMDSYERDNRRPEGDLVWPFPKERLAARR